MNPSLRAESCVVCAGPLRLWREKANQDGRFRIEQCTGRCGFVFVNPRPGKSDLRHWYQDFGQVRAVAADAGEVVRRELDYPNSTIDAARMIRQMKLFRPEAARLLDVGCGWGFFTKAAREAGFEVVALEMASNERECARIIAGIEPLNFAFEEFVSSGESFDCLLMSQILEHAADVNEWMERAYHLLAPGGLLCIALPNFNSLFRRLMAERDPYVTPPTHLNFFTRRSLGHLVSKHGFQVLAIEEISRLPNDVVSRRLLWRGKAKRLVEGVTQIAGRAYSLAADSLHMGIMLNVYCQKTPLFAGLRNS